MKTDKDQAPAQASEPDRTPDNTPLPGGGRWAWDDIAKAWAEVLTDAAEPTKE